MAKERSVSEIFESMDYGEAPEDARLVRAWLAEHPPFGHFVDGKWREGHTHFASVNPATGEVLAQIAAANSDDIAAAVAAAKKAQGAWAKDAKFRARKLYALARHIQKQARFLAVLESLDNGKPIRESRDADIPLAARHFYHHAGWAQLAEGFDGLEPLGVIGQIIPWNFPFLMLAWKLAPALAAGNAVVLKPAEQTALTALYFAEMCQAVGLPDGVVNIVTGAGDAGAMLVEADIDKIAFTGSTEVGRKIQEQCAQRALPLTLELGGKSPFIVFEDADLDAAVEGIVNAIWYNQGEVCCAGSRLLMQEKIAAKLLDKLRARMGKLRIGNPLDKSIDIGAMIDDAQRQRVEALVASCKARGGEVFQAGDIPANGSFFPPTLIAGLETSDPLAQEEIFGPVLVAMRFRTEKEAVAMANQSRYGLAASIWSENLDQCLSTAPLLEAGVVWINTHNLFDAAAPFGGVKESGFGREGGHVGMLDYLRPVTKSQKAPALKLGKGVPSAIDVTRKFLIGGKETRPDGGYSQAILDKDAKPIDFVGIGNRKDIRNAVEAARASTWRRANAHNRAQVLYYFGENLERRAPELIETLAPVLSKAAAKKEVAKAVDHCFTFAAWADKHKGTLGDVPARAVALVMNAPRGVIGIVPERDALLAAPLRAVLAALSMGNAVVLAAPEHFPLAALDLGGVAQNSDVPAGALNIVSGDARELAEPMLKHAGMDAVWDFYDLGEMRAFAAMNIKQVLTGDAAALPEEWLLKAAVEVKTIWLPYGALY